MTNEMHNSYNQFLFLFYSFLSALHVLNESSRSSSGALPNNCITQFCTIVQASPALNIETKQIYNYRLSRSILIAAEVKVQLSPRSMK